MLNVSRSLREIKDQSEILQELTHSLNHTNVLGIFLKNEEEMTTTSVKAIDYTDKGIIINLNDQDLHGYPIERTRIPLSEITSVIHFNTCFDDPVYVQIRMRRKESQPVATALN
jgi:hypothetical protein